jgi:hypothetical protein
MSTQNYPELNPSPGAKWVKSLTRDRLNNFHGGRYSDYNLSSVLFTQRIDDANHVKLEVWSAPGMSKPTFKEAMKQKFKPAKKVSRLTFKSSNIKCSECDGREIHLDHHVRYPRFVSKLHANTHPIAGVFLHLVMPGLF